MGIVKMPFVVIIENLVGFADRFEFNVRFRPLVFWDFVWVTRKGSLAGSSKASIEPPRNGPCGMLS